MTKSKLLNHKRIVRIYRNLLVKYTRKSESIFNIAVAKYYIYFY